MRLRCSWFVNLSTTAGFFTWWSINLTYIRFCTSFLNFHRGSFEPLHDFAQGVDTKYRESIAPGSRTGTGCSRGLPFGVSSVLEFESRYPVLWARERRVSIKNLRSCMRHPQSFLFFYTTEGEYFRVYAHVSLLNFDVVFVVV